MKNFEKIILIEKADLYLKIKDMINFIKSRDFDEIKEIDKRLMKGQVFYMNKYLKILKKRIKNF